MSPSAAPDVIAALRRFVARTDEIEPAAPSLGLLTLSLGGRAVRMELRVPVARALVEALLSYQDPRDRGSCSSCGSRQLDDYFVCKGCGATNGVFGQLVAERAARYAKHMPAIAAKHRRTND